MISFLGKNKLAFDALFLVFISVFLSLLCGHLMVFDRFGCVSKSLGGAFYNSKHTSEVDIFAVASPFFMFFVFFAKVFLQKQNKKPTRPIFFFFVKFSDFLFKINYHLILAFRKGRLNPRIYNIVF